MQISDGFDACEKITELFNKPKLFNYEDFMIKINDSILPGQTF